MADVFAMIKIYNQLVTYLLRIDYTITFNISLPLSNNALKWNLLIYSINDRFHFL